MTDQGDLFEVERRKRQADYMRAYRRKLELAKWPWLATPPPVVFGRGCDRCGSTGEVALDVGCLAYLCEECWGPGRHTCGQCEDRLCCPTGER